MRTLELSGVFSRGTTQIRMEVTMTGAQVVATKAVSLQGKALPLTWFNSP